MGENIAETCLPRGSSQNAGSFGFTSPAHSRKHINQQGPVVNDSAPNQSPALNTPVRNLQACLNERVSGVSIPRDEMLAAVSHINEAIDKMSRDQLVVKLAELNLDICGKRNALGKRLKSYYTNLRITQCHQMLSDSERMQFDYLVVIDFEATCDEHNTNFVQEIIEFPAVLVDVRCQTVCGVFRNFCKPKVNPVLTSFCTSLTGITQDQVDCAMDFTDVLKNFEVWLRLFNLGTIYKFAIVTDGPWDIAKFFKFQVDLAVIDLPWWARQWINIRKVYRAFYDSGYVNLQQMLSKSGMEFQGRPHCGLDDAMNIASVVVRLLYDGCIFTFNEYFRSDASDGLSVMNM